MSSDFQSLGEIAKAYIKEKKSDNVDSYSFSMLVS